MDKVWIHKQEVDLLINLNDTTFYLVETHHDCIPDPNSPDFSFPLVSNL